MPGTGDSVSGDADAIAGAEEAIGPEVAGTDVGARTDETPIADDTRRTGKSLAAFRTISEVSADLEVPQHVLRFWESKFVQLRPLKRGGGRRYYRPEDVALLRRIHDLLYREGYTIRGVQRVLKAPRRPEAEHTADLLDGATEQPELRPAPPDGPAGDALLRHILTELKTLRALLD